MIPVLLDELNSHAKRIEKEHVQPFVTALFSIVDDISLDVDAERGFSIGSTPLRVHWLIRRLTEDRFSIEERTELYRAATVGASLDWLIDFTDSAVHDYEGNDGQPKIQPPDQCLTTQDAIPELKKQALQRLRSAARDGSLIKAHNFHSNLYRWRELSDDNGAEMKAWLAEAMKADDVLIVLAKMLTGESWSHGMGGFGGGLGDRVAKRNIRIRIRPDFDLFDLKTFKANLERIVAEQKFPQEDIDAVKKFLNVWAKQRDGED